MQIDLPTGIRLEVDTAGPADAPAVMLVMGLGLQLTAWPDTFLQGLHARGLRTVRFDNRDVGLSSRVRGGPTGDIRIEALRSMFGLTVRAPYSLHDMAADVTGLMDALRINSAHVVGVSMGGMIGQVLAATAPDRVRSFVSVMSSSGARRFLFHRSAATRAVLTTPPRGVDEERLLDHLQHIWTLIGSPGLQPAPPVLRERLRANLHRGGGDGSGTMRQMLAIMHSGDRTRLLRRITAPTLVVHGQLDPLVPIAAGEDTARHIPGAHFEPIAGMAHDLPEALVPQLVQCIGDHIGTVERTMVAGPSAPRTST